MPATEPPRARAKYPRTWHLACSPGKHRDDRQHATDSHLVNVDVVITEKLDGAGVSLHHDGVYARTKAGPPNHPSYSPLKALHATVAWQLPPELSVFGEWCHTIHSITYPDLPADRELQLFAVRDDHRDVWWPWPDVVTLADSLGVPTVPVVHTGRFANVAELSAVVNELVARPSVYGPDREGVVVRVADGFTNDEFVTSMSKWVRPNHVAGERWERFGVRRHQTHE